MGGAEGGATAGWLSTPPAAAEGAPAGEDVSELKKQARALSMRAREQAEAKPNPYPNPYPNP